MLDGPGIESRAGTRNFSLLQNVNIDSGAHPHTCSMGIEDSILGIKRPGREGDYSPSNSAEVKNEFSYSSAVHIPLRVVHSIVLAAAIAQSV